MPEESWISRKSGLGLLWRASHKICLAVAFSLVAQLSLSGCAWSPIRYGAHINILHLNDVYDVTPNEDGAGGLARVKTLVDEARRKDPSTLLIISGDFLSPSLLSSLDKGSSVIEILNLLQVDYVTFGNHDFDFGMDILKKRIKQSKFKWISSNILELGGRIPGTTFVDIRKINRVNVGFFGLLDSKAVDSFYMPKEIDILDTVDAARRAVKALRKRNAEVIVAITHMDMDADRVLARSVPGIDLILGGHDHVEINEATSGEATRGPATSGEATRGKARSGIATGVPRIIKSGYNATTVGEVSIFTRGGKKDTVDGRHLEVNASIPEDPQVANMISKSIDNLNASYQVVLGTTLVPLDATSSGNRRGETNLGNYIADTMRKTMVADIAVMNGGAIVSGKVIKTGVITKKDLLSILPFENVLCKVMLKGGAIKEALEHSFARYEMGKGAFLQISGMKIVADISQPSGQRIKSVVVGEIPLEEEREYTLALNDYLLRGGDGYTMLANTQILISDLYGQLVVDALASAIKESGVIDPKTDGRLTIIVGD